MDNFCVEFCDGDNHLTLEFEVYSTNLAQRWYDLLVEILKEDPTIREADRLYDFPGSSWNETATVDRINGCIHTINAHEHIIDELAVLGNRTQLNMLHKRFEDIRGGLLSPSDYWVRAPEAVRDAINDFNIQIHRLEDIHDAERNFKPWPHVVITFLNFKRNLLTTDDYKLFDTEKRFGEVYLNYCEVGKSLWNVYFDGDDVVGDDNIRPLRHYSPEMMIAFYDATMRSELPKFWAWWDENAAHLAQLGFNKDDQDLSIGAIPVACLKTDLDRQELVNAISSYDRVNRVYIP